MGGPWRLADPQALPAAPRRRHRTSSAPRAPAGPWPLSEPPECRFSKQGPIGRASFVRPGECGRHLVQLLLVLGAQVRRAELDLDALDLARERERRLIGVGDRGAGIRADAEGVDAEAASDRIGDASAADLLAIDPDYGFA